MQLILEVLRKDKIYAKFAKCKFWINEVHFLGHVVSSKGIHVNLVKIEVVKDWKAPTKPTEVHQFLGIVGY